MPDHEPSKKARVSAGVLYAALAVGTIPARQAPNEPIPARHVAASRGRTRRVALGDLFSGIPWAGV